MAGPLATVTWDNLTVAGGFLVGAALATVATLRIVKHVTTFFATIQRQQDESFGVGRAGPGTDGGGPVPGDQRPPQPDG